MRSVKIWQSNKHYPYNIYSVSSSPILLVFWLWRKPTPTQRVHANSNPTDSNQGPSCCEATVLPTEWPLLILLVSEMLFDHRMLYLNHLVGVNSQSLTPLQETHLTAISHSENILCKPPIQWIIPLNLVSIEIKCRKSIFFMSFSFFFYVHVSLMNFYHFFLIMEQVQDPARVNSFIVLLGCVGISWFPTSLGRCRSIKSVNL